MDSSNPSGSQQRQHLNNIDSMSLTNLLDLLQHGELDQRMQSIFALVNDYMPNTHITALEDDIFCTLIPGTKNVLINVYSKNLELIDSSDVKVLNKLKCNFSKCVELLRCMESVLDFILFQNDLEYAHFKSVPTHLFFIVHQTYEHCKTSLENDFLQSAEELHHLFKVAEDLNMKLIELMNSKLKLDISTSQETQILEVLDSLCNLAEINSRLSLQTALSNWKAYIALVVKQYKFFESDIDIKKPLDILSTEILVLITNAIRANTPEIQQNLKFANFLVRVASKLLDTCWNICQCYSKDIMMFFITLHRIHQIYQDFECDLSSKNLINEQIFCAIEPVLLRLLEDILIFGDESTEFQDDATAFLFLSAEIFPKLDYSRRQQQTLLHLNAIFNCINEEAISNTFLYENLVVNLAAKLLSVTPYEFGLIESMLMNRLMVSNLSQNILAFDLWLLMMRNIPPTLCYDIIVNCVEAFKKATPLSSTKQTEMFGKFLEFANSMLPISLQSKLIEKYTPEFSTNVWRFVGFECIPSSKSHVRNVVVNEVTKMMDELNSPRFDCDAFNNLVDGIWVLSSYRFEDKFDFTSITNLIIRLWNLDLSDLEHINSDFFTYLLSAIFALTVQSIHLLNIDLITVILDQLQHVSRLGHFVKIFVYDLLIVILTKQSRKLNISDHLPKINKLIQLLRIDNCPMITELAVELEAKVSDTVWNKRPLAEQNPQRNKPLAGPPKVLRISPHKKQKIDADTEIDTILDEMKVNVKDLIKHSSAGKLSKQQVKVVADLARKLESLLQIS